MNLALLALTAIFIVIATIYALMTGNIRKYFPRFVRISQRFSEKHPGIDISALHGSDILSPIAGTITRVWEDNLNGKAFRVSNGVHEWGYAHNSEIHVKVGDIVKKGQIIAKIGNTGVSTGPHAHVKLYDIKKGININPESYFV